MAVGALAGGALSLRWRPRRAPTVAHLGLAPSALQLAALVGPSPILVSMAAGCVCVAVAAVLLVPRLRSLRQDRDGNLYGWPELDEPARAELLPAGER